MDKSRPVPCSQGCLPWHVCTPGPRSQAASWVQLSRPQQLLLSCANKKLPKSFIIEAFTEIFLKATKIKAPPHFLCSINETILIFL